MIQISFPDGRVQEYKPGITALEIAQSISEGLARNIIAAKANDQVIEISRPIHKDSKIQLLTWNDKDGKSTFWHSTAHLMAEAIEALFPQTKFGIGPAIENGFYYDIDTGGKALSLNDLQAIETKMVELAKTNSVYQRKEIGKAEAIEYFQEKGDQYKLELLEGLEDVAISFYTQGNFTDLCKGPHLPNTGLIKAIKLTSIAGAYWRGDESRPQMTRIYGISFPKQKELDEHLLMLEEAKKRDHRKLGQELELFMFSERVGAGLPIWLPKGTALRQRLEDFLKQEQINRGYTPVITPHIGHKNLYITSGHWEKYGADSFQAIKTPREGEEFLLKPMNCPHHCEIFAHKPRSYRDLPLRIAEFGTVYRYEQSGELHGLTRVRCFTQDDAHIFCTPDQVKEEFLSVLDLTMFVIRKLGFEHFTAQISLRDPENKEKYIGSDENWVKAEQAIIDATKENGLPTTTVIGEAAFYGPKLDFMVKDALGRSWQLGTIQVDYNLPDRFELEYIGSDNAKHRPVMIHRAPFGSMERFIGVLTEHCAGKFPLWLTPDQYMILPVSDKFLEYSKKVELELKKAGLRGGIDDRLESIGKKIRDNELKKIPYMLIIGDKESSQDVVSIRKQGMGDQGTMTISEFVTLINAEL
ncbi:MAG: threonine--tRNA ligase [Saprospiraceae bacterium]